MHNFTPYSALLGGVLIGLAASLFLFAYGRVAGISGLWAELWKPSGRSRSLALLFILGLAAGGVSLRWVYPEAFASAWLPSLPLAGLAGVLVGVGTSLGNGCTSGHGICGVSRGSRRSFVATGTFMLTGFVTVFLLRQWGGGL